MVKSKGPQNLPKENDVNINDKICGFTVDRCVPLKELDAQLFEMTHDKTGARLVWISREEENKTFAITFETLPFDDTGVFHILEHSVLCGSDRYPVKEPFVELLKNSMNTFLNAMTFPDKTMYPVSSKNDRDFLNLMRVYMDAVFRPAIYTKPEIFMQEGWHYEIDENGQASYKGVVFNEMKGALADASEVMEAAMDRALFPDTPYSFISGGDPAAIPELTYEKFIETHQKYYSPANSIIYLDGDLDIEEVLGILDGEFLTDLPKGARVSPPALQQPVDGGTRIVPYEIGPDEPADSRIRTAWGRGLGTFGEREKTVAMDILAEVLAGSNEAYLNRLILKEGLAEDVILRAYDGVGQTWVRLEARNHRKEDAERIETILFGEMERLAREGIDREKLEAVMANQEFLMGERDFGTYPQGLFFGFLVMDSMLYGGAPEANLEKGDLFDRLRARMEEGYFEDLLREVMLENPHRCRIILEPSATLGEERRAKEAARLSAEHQAWTDEQLAEVVAKQQALQEWQAGEDDPADLAKLPHLTLEDMDDTPEDIPTEVKELGGVRVLRHPVPSGDVRYVNLYFDVPARDEESLHRISFLAELLGTLPAADMDGQKLITEQQRLMGRMNFDLLVFAENNSTDISGIRFTASFSALESKACEAADLMVKVLTDTHFDEHAMTSDILKQCKQERMQSFIMGGHAAALRRVSAMGRSSGAAQDAITGYGYYNWISEQIEAGDPEALEKALSSAMQSVLASPDLTISVTGGREYDETALCGRLAEGLTAAAGDRAQAEAGPAAKPAAGAIEAAGFSKEAIAIPADIAFTAIAGDLLQAGSDFNGKMQVAARIISLAHLWNVIRVQGGAYGAGMSVYPSGLIACYSYRDPDGAASLDKFRSCADFLREAAASDMDLTGFIIGAVSDASPLLTPRLKAQIGDSFYFRGVTWEDRCRTRRELLSVTREDLAALADSIEEALAGGGTCIVSSPEQIEAASPDSILKI